MRMNITKELKKPPKDWRFYCKWIGLGLIVASIIVWDKGEWISKIDWKWFIGIAVSIIGIIVLMILNIPSLDKYLKGRNKGQYYKQVRLKNSYEGKNDNDALCLSNPISFEVSKTIWKSITKEQYYKLKDECIEIEHLEFRNPKKGEN